MQNTAAKRKQSKKFQIIANRIINRYSNLKIADIST